jgi:drug/metabolite transporter (DMT)-like permease
MIWLILSILLNTYIGIVFKVYERFGISNLQAIAFNYWICAVTGLVYLGHIPSADILVQKNYWLWAGINGIAYFVVFLAIGKCTAAVGVNATQTANKLSLVIPVAIAILFLGEGLSLLKVAGIVLAIIAVMLSTAKEKSGAETNAKQNASSLMLPAFIFIGSGLLDSLSNYLQRTYLQQTADANYYLVATFSAAALGSTCYLIAQMLRGKEIFALKNLIAAIVLGIPNYFSIYSLLQSLGSGVLQSSSLIPVNNIAVVLCSTVFAILFFREKLNAKNYLGLGFAVLSIALLCIA